MKLFGKGVENEDYRNSSPLSPSWDGKPLWRQCCFSWALYKKSGRGRRYSYRNYRRGRYSKGRGFSSLRCVFTLWRKTYFSLSLSSYCPCLENRKKALGSLSWHAGYTQLFYCQGRAEESSREEYFGSLWGNEEGALLLCGTGGGTLEMQSELGRRAFGEAGDTDFREFCPEKAFSRG